MKINKKQMLIDLIYVILGNFILSLGVALFIVPNNILSAGVAGIAVAIQPLIAIVSTTDLITILTIALFVIGAFILGKNFAIKTLISSFVYPFFVSAITGMLNGMVITDNNILASFYGGALVGIGVGLVFKGGGSTGGMDIPALIMNKFLHIPLGTAVIMVDSSIVLTGMLLHGIEPALIGLISVWSSGFTVNKTMMLGTNTAKSVMIISEQYEEILKEVYKQIDRGATLLDAHGGYTGLARKVLMVVIMQKQYPELNRIIQSIDPGAFVVVQDVNQIAGEGFTYNKEKIRNYKQMQNIE